MTLNIAGSRGRTYATRAAGVATAILLLATAAGCGSDDKSDADRKAEVESIVTQAKQTVPKELVRRGFTDPVFANSRDYGSGGVFTYFFVSAGNCRGAAAVSGSILKVTFADDKNKNVTLDNASAKDVFAHPELGKVCKAIPTPKQ